MNISDCIFGVPIDFFYRVITDSKISNVSPRREFKLKNIFESFAGLFKLRYYQRLIFIPDRPDLITKAELLLGDSGIIVLSFESGNKDLPKEYIDGAIFDLLRGVMRLMFLSICVIFIYRYILKKKYDYNLWVYLKVCSKIMSDTFYNYTLKLFFKGEVYYSIATIPGVEKFQNVHVSTEIQHGVIHKNHNGFIGLPNVKNVLLVDNEFYAEFLNSVGYKGKVEVNKELERYTKTNNKSDMSRKVVAVFTQPGEIYQELFQTIVGNLEKRGVKFVIRKHPLDQTLYKTDQVQSIDLIDALESQIGICSTSTIAEHFIESRRTIIMVKPELLDEKIWRDFTEHYQDYARYNGSNIICCENVQELENVSLL